MQRAIGSQRAHACSIDRRWRAYPPDISLAVSDPCFEFWLVLHLGESPGCLRRHAMQARVKKLGGIDEKSVRFEKVRAGYMDAVRRALRIDETAVADGEEDR
jgi:hypothetical protein